MVDELINPLPTISRATAGIECAARLPWPLHAPPDRTVASLLGVKIVATVLRERFEVRARACWKTNRPRERIENSQPVSP
ncbi:hypothetical protein [Streptomyces sp. HUAS ZL42]|uniref:hypothetical protein n=1 Tax=Streptomyces sp. HUAS ZL42 TaxID=3231715 RepID=UPI00345EA9A1